MTPKIHYAKNIHYQLRNYNCFCIAAFSRAHCISSDGYKKPTTQPSDFRSDFWRSVQYSCFAGVFNNQVIFLLWPWYIHSHNASYYGYCEGTYPCDYTLACYYYHSPFHSQFSLYRRNGSYAWCIKQAEYQQRNCAQRSYHRYYRTC